MVDFDNAANRSLLAYLGQPDRLERSVSVAKAKRSCAPAEIDDPYYRLGTHPELVERLWDELGGPLPADCRYIVFGAPVLVRPDSGVIFGFAGGTIYSLRLPPRERAEALSAGAERIRSFPAYQALGIEASVLDLRHIGEAWVFGCWDKREHEWCLAAYEDAAAGP